MRTYLTVGGRWCVWVALAGSAWVGPRILRAAEPVASTEKTQAQEVLDVAGAQGGLVVHVGCGDGKLTAALCASDRYPVHALDTNAQDVAAARSCIRSLELYGRASIDGLDGKRLPYVDNPVSLGKTA